MGGRTDTSNLLGLDALRRALHGTRVDVSRVLTEYGPNALLAAALVVVYAALFWVLSRFAQALLRRLVRRGALRTEAQSTAGQVLRIVLRLTLLMVILVSVTALFPPVSDWGGPVFRAYLLLLVLYVGWGALGHVLQVQARSWKLDASLQLLLGNLTRTLWGLLGVYLVSAQFGINLVPILGGLGVVGLAVGFAAQDILANLISGVTLLLDRPFRIGDWIRTESYEGQVASLTLRTTRVRTRDGEYVSIPNKDVAGAVVENLSLGGQLRVHVNLYLTYGESTDRAREALLGVLPAFPEVLTDPAPQVLVEELEESRVRLLLRFWVDAEHVAGYPVLRMKVLEAGTEALRAAGLRVPYARMQVQLRPLPPEAQGNDAAG